MPLQEDLQTSLGRAYTLEKELGGGGMSRVFVAEETALGRRVVVKVLAPEMAAGVSIERFKREIAFAARLQHPHIVPLLNAGDAGGIPYFTMPFIEGQTLRARLTRDGELPVNEGIRILREVASALDYAHEQGVVHRDIKPDNILLSRGSAMVTDFGVAKALSASTNGDVASGATSLGVALGTPAYMSPEQAAASPNIDGRADIYAWGIVAYEMFAGRSPFAGRSAQAMLAAQVTETPDSIAKLRTSLPPALSALVMRCLEKHAADRPQGASELIHALDGLATPTGGLPPAHRNSPIGNRWWPAITIGLIAVGVIASITLRQRFRAQGSSVSIAAPKSVAVLPFENGSHDPKDEYLSDGISEELMTALSVPGLRVMSRSSSFAFKGKGLTGRQVGESLHVAYVVEGLVSRVGDRMVTRAQLVNVADGSAPWGKRYDEAAKDVMAVQQQIAGAIAAALRVALGDSATVPSSGTKDIEAHDLYMKGRFYWNQRNKGGIEKAIQYFAEAVARDSTYALAYAGLAEAHAVSNEWAGVDERIADRNAEAAARRALQLDSMLAGPHATLGVIYRNRLRWRESEEESRKAIALRPDYATAHHWYNILLRIQGRYDSAEAEIRRARSLDPMSAAIATNIGMLMLARGDHDRAITELSDALEKFPEFIYIHQHLGTAYGLKGDYARAESEFRMAARAGYDPMIDLGWLYGISGRTAEAEAIRRKLRSGTPDHVGLALVEVGMGDKAAALADLEKAPPLDAVANSWLPEFRGLRSEPRFRALRRRWGLPE